MVVKYLAMGFAIAAFGAKGSAQTLSTPRGASPPAVPTVDIRAWETQLTPLYLEAIKERQLTSWPKAQPLPPRKECPMPVHRPDTARLEQMRVYQPSPSVGYPMPRADLKCFNPLDPAK